MDIFPIDNMLTRGEWGELTNMSPSKCQKFAYKNNSYCDKIHAYFYECRFYGCLCTMGHEMLMMFWSRYSYDINYKHA